MTALRRSPNFPAFLGFLYPSSWRRSREVWLPSHGKCPAPVWSMGMAMARFTDAQRNWGAGGSHAHSEGYGESSDTGSSTALR